MIRVDMADENEVCFRKARVECPRTHRIIVNHLPLPAHDKGGMVDRVNDDVAVGGDEMIARQVGGARQLEPR